MKKMKNKPLLLLSTLLLLTGCSSPNASSDASSSDQSSGTIASSGGSLSEAISSSKNGSVSSTNEHSSSASSEIIDSSSSSEEASIEQSLSSESIAKYYELKMSFNPKVNAKGLKQRYQEGATVSFSIEYDENELINVKVLLNGSPLSPVSDKAYSFLMPNKDSTLVITGEDAIKKYHIAENVENATISYINLDENDRNNGLTEGTEVKFQVFPSADYGVTSVSVTYLDEDGVSVEAELSLQNNIYTFLMPAANISINVETGRLYQINFPSSINVGFNIQYVEGSNKAAPGASVSFKINQTDPSYLFRSVSLWTNFDFSEKTGTGAVNCYQRDDIYTFTMPKKNIYVIVNADKRYTVKTEKDDNVESITIDSPKDYYLTSDEVAFSVAFKEGYKADKVQLVKSDGTIALLLPDENGKYSFKGLTSDVTIKVTSKAIDAGDTSYWSGDTIYYYEEKSWRGDSYTSYKYLEEITVHPETETLDIIVYMRSYSDGGDEWYARRPIIRKAYANKGTPEWQKGGEWSKMGSYQFTNLPYTFDRNTNKMVATDSEKGKTYTLTFTIKDGEAVSLLIDTNAFSDFSTTNQTFTRF